MRHPGNEWNKGTIKVTGKNADSPAPIPDNQPTGKRHGQQGPDRRGKKDQPHYAIVDTKLILNSRQARKIIGMYKAVEEENDLDSETGRRHVINMD